jgi:hypothetical protein
MDNRLYDFEKQSFDAFHIKLCTEKIHEGDFFTLEDFSKIVKAPVEAYEKHLSIINHEVGKHTIAVQDDMMFAELGEDILSEMFEKDKIFLGEYDIVMQQKIHNYIEEKGWGKYRREERIRQPGESFHYCYHLRFYEWTHSPGFFYKRLSLMRSNYDDEFIDDFQDRSLWGHKADFENLFRFLRLDYIEYIFGKRGAEKLKEKYQKEFLDSFEFGTSLLYIV